MAICDDIQHLIPGCWCHTCERHVLDAVRQAREVREGALAELAVLCASALLEDMPPLALHAADNMMVGCGTCLVGRIKRVPS